MKFRHNPVIVFFSPVQAGSSETARYQLIRKLRPQFRTRLWLVRMLVIGEEQTVEKGIRKTFL